MFDRTLLQLPRDHLPRPHGNCYWLIPGSVMAGEYPRTLEEPGSRTKLAAILCAGIRRFIDLTEADERLESYGTLLQSEARQLGVAARHTRFPITDLSVPTPDQMRDILRAIQQAHADGQPVYLHCWGGIGRTGTVVGCLMVESGLTGDEALALIASKWTVMDKRHSRPRSPETLEQARFIRDWARRWSGVGVAAT